MDVKKNRDLIMRTFLTVALFAALISCSPEKPEGILPRDEMVSIMEDIYISEEKVNHLALSRDSSKIVFKAMSKKVFDNAQITDSVFKRSFDYYMERPKEMELIYTALVDSLQLREQRAPVP